MIISNNILAVLKGFTSKRVNNCEISKDKTKEEIVLKRIILIFSVFFGLVMFFAFNRQSKSLNEPNGNIVLLTYHQILENSDNDEPWQFYRKFDDFKKDMKVIKESGINICSYQELITQISDGKEIIEPTIIIQFDDGLNSDYDLAFPILKEFDLKATFFISTGRTSGNNNGFTSWDQVKEMYEYKNDENQNLFEFGVHGYSHTSLSQNEEESHEEWKERLHFELDQPQKDFHTNLGFKPSLLALPFGSGFGNEELNKMASELNYELIRGWKEDDNHFVTNNPSNLKFFGVYNNSDINDAINLALNINPE